MKRREFITLLGGAAAAWPVVARAQQAERMRRIGVLMNLAESDPEGRTRLAAFVQRLEELGWAAGSNVRFDGEVAKPRIAVTAGIGGNIFIPDDHQGDVLALQLPMKRRPIRLGVPAMPRLVP